MHQRTLLGIQLSRFFLSYPSLTLIDVECLKLATSKMLGIGIILFSSILKLPQIMLCMRNKAVEGLSFLSIFLEVIWYAPTFFSHSVKLRVTGILGGTKQSPSDSMGRSLLHHSSESLLPFIFDNQDVVLIFLFAQYRKASSTFSVPKALLLVSLF